MPLLTKPFATLITLIRSLPGVGSHMSLQITQNGKLLAAIFTPKGFFASVSPHVFLQVIQSTKLPVALITLVCTRKILFTSITSLLFFQVRYSRGRHLNWCLTLQ